jgi:hypothetical protein
VTAARWTAVALEKLSNVVGRERAEEVLATTLLELGVDDLRSANDLYAFAQRVKRMEGFVGAVGALLSVHAVIHGAVAPRDAA